MGAVGAHVVHDAAAMTLIEKASYYQLIHTVALLSIKESKNQITLISKICWMAGIILFSGSLYLKAFDLISQAPLAPMGGTLFMLGWIAILATKTPK